MMTKAERKREKERGNRRNVYYNVCVSRNKVVHVTRSEARERERKDRKVAVAALLVNQTESRAYERIVSMHAPIFLFFSSLSLARSVFFYTMLMLSHSLFVLFSWERSFFPLHCKTTSRRRLRLSVLLFPPSTNWTRSMCDIWLDEQDREEEEKRLK